VLYGCPSIDGHANTVIDTKLTYKNGCSIRFSSERKYSSSQLKERGTFSKIFDSDEYINFIISVQKVPSIEHKETDARISFA
jgi:hypothetical protein